MTSVYTIFLTVLVGLLIGRGSSLAATIPEVGKIDFKGAFASLLAVFLSAIFWTALSILTKVRPSRIIRENKGKEEFIEKTAKAYPIDEQWPERYADLTIEWHEADKVRKLDIIILVVVAILCLLWLLVAMAFLALALQGFVLGSAPLLLEELRSLSPL